MCFHSHVPAAPWSRVALESLAPRAPALRKPHSHGPRRTVHEAASHHRNRREEPAVARQVAWQLTRFEVVPVCEV